jgi:hypothetical protein
MNHMQRKSELMKIYRAGRRKRTFLDSGAEYLS